MVKVKQRRRQKAVVTEPRQPKLQVAGQITCLLLFGVGAAWSNAPHGPAWLNMESWAGLVCLAFGCLLLHRLPRDRRGLRAMFGGAAVVVVVLLSGRNLIHWPPFPVAFLAELVPAPAYAHAVPACVVAYLVYAEILPAIWRPDWLSEPLSQVVTSALFVLIPVTLVQLEAYFISGSHESAKFEQNAQSLIYGIGGMGFAALGVAARFYEVALVIGLAALGALAVMGTLYLVYPGPPMPPPLALPP
jgi:hypothetical protein